MEKATTTFDATKFPYTKTSPELKAMIDKIIAEQSIPIQSRIDSLSPAGHALYEKALALQTKLIQTIENPGWSVKDKEANFVSYTMKGEEGFLCVKSVAIIPATPIELLAYIKMDQYKTDYDKNYLSGKEIESFPANMRIMHFIFKGNFFVSNRDFVMLQYTTYEPDGTIKVAIGSIEDPRVPPAKDPVRARTLIGGFLIKPAGEGKSELTYVTQVDLAGSIPQMLQNTVAKGQSQKALMIADNFAKRFPK